MCSAVASFLQSSEPRYFEIGCSLRRVGNVHGKYRFASLFQTSVMKDYTAAAAQYLSFAMIFASLGSVAQKLLLPSDLYKVEVNYVHFCSCIILQETRAALCGRKCSKTTLNKHSYGKILGLFQAHAFDLPSSARSSVVAVVLECGKFLSTIIGYLSRDSYHCISEPICNIRILSALIKLDLVLSRICLRTTRQGSGLSPRRGVSFPQAFALCRLCKCVH